MTSSNSTIQKKGEGKIPQKEAERLAENNKDIPTSEIQQDIIDTEREIATMLEEADHLENTPLSLSTARWDHMRADARRSGVEEREHFVSQLKAILKVRGVLNV